MRSPTSSGIRLLELLEVRRKATLGTVETHPAGDLGAAERPRGGPQRQLLPGDQAQHLAIGLAQPREKRHVLAMAFVDLLEPTVRLPLHSPRLCHNPGECYTGRHQSERAIRAFA